MENTINFNEILNLNSQNRKKKIKKYECPLCAKIFSSRQSKGGHINMHKKNLK